MKIIKIIKTIINYIKGKLWVLMIIPLTVIIIQHIKINHLNDDLQIKNVQLSTYRDSVSVYIAENGQLVNQIETVEIEKDNLKESLEMIGVDVNKLKGENIQWKKINNALTLELEAASHVETSLTDTFYIQDTDTVYYIGVDDWTNGYLSLYNGEIFNKSLNFDYQYRAELDIFQTRVKKSTIVNVTISDPNAKIISANSIVVNDVTKWYEKWWMWGLAGFTGGVIIAK